MAAHRIQRVGPGIGAQLQALHSALNEHYFPSQAAAIFDLQGRLLAEKSLPDDHRVRLPPGIAPFAEETRFATVTDKTPKLATGRRVAYQRVTAARENKSYLIVVSQDLASISDDLELLRGIFLAAIPAALLLASSRATTARRSAMRAGPRRPDSGAAPW